MGSALRGTLCGFGLIVMLRHALRKLGGTAAFGALVTRVGIVGANFAVMLGLTIALGLAQFGALIFLWGQALVLSTIVSCGAPLLLLRNLSDGRGMSRRQIAQVVVFLPGVLCIIMASIADFASPQSPVAEVIAAAFCINLLSCLASIMRALGSVQTSMMLRDAGPFVALGIVGVIGTGLDVAALVLAASLLMLVTSSLALIWCLRRSDHPAATEDTPSLGWSWSLWGTQVLGMALAQVDLILGGMLLPAQDLGLYAILRRVANVVALPVSVASWVSAKPIAQARGAHDRKAMQVASAHGSQIAWVAGLGLAVGCFAGLGLMSIWPGSPITTTAAQIFAVLVLGALVQAFFASGLTVATLGSQARLSVIARGMSILFYVGAVALLGSALSSFGNAVCYVSAITLGSILVWWGVWQRFQIDTSAFVLFKRGRGDWRTS